MSRINFIVLLLGSLCCVSQTTRASSDDTLPNSRAEFKQAYAAALTGTGLDASTDSEALRRYSLYSYLQAARLESQLAGTIEEAASLDKATAEFIQAHELHPVAREVRRAWLLSLAERSQWDIFLKEYRDSQDDTVRCQYFNARIATQDTAGLVPLVSQRWLTPTQLPMACENAFTWLRTQNAITPAMFEQRVRGILRQGNVSFARQIIAQAPAEQTVSLRQWADVIQQPQSEMERLIASPAVEVDAEVLLDGWTRLARSLPDVAIRRYSALLAARHLDKESASPYALALALSLAWNRRDEALQYFDLVLPTQRDERAYEWETRAALRVGDWQRARRTILAMPEPLRATARWRYWLARSQELLGQKETAHALYASVLADDNYYSAISAARLAQPFEPHAIETKRDDAIVASLSKEPALIRARELFLCSLRDLALVEWRTALPSIPESQQVQLIHLARGWGWYEIAIETSAQKKLYNDYRLLYPHPYDEEVATAAQRTGLSRELIYGVMRQESRYLAEVVSTAGAVGLLQLHPETAKQTARRLQIPKYSSASLIDPKTNILLGAVNLKSLEQRFNSQLPLMLAGYNAGPNATARWLPPSPLDADIWIENIPFNETRNYVQRVLWQMLVYSWLKSGKPQDTKELMGTIAAGR